MAQKREHLEKLLFKLDEWANEKGNEWFKAELSTRYGIAEISSFKSLEGKIDFIQNYLMLDGLRCIDYSDIEDKTVQHHLNLDCIMMARYEGGKIDNQPNFEEFCRYAHYQAEDLVNYYFHKRHNSNVNFLIVEINKTKDKDSQYTPNAKYFPKTISDISYWYKVDLLATICTIPNKYKEDIKLLKNLRNLLSHRDSFSLRDENLVYLKFKEKGFHLFDDKRDLTALNPTDKNIFNDGKVVYFLREKNYDQVFDALSILKHSAISNIKTILPDKPIKLFGKELFIKK